jgi:hypothetical protein
MRVALRRAILAGTYPLMVGIMAMAMTVSMTIPFASILIGAVLLRRDQWKEIVLVASLGSATGGLFVYLIFHYLGWNQIVDAYPDLTESKAWTDATAWVSDYGTWALAWHCRNAGTANPGADLHRDVALAGFRSLPCNSWKAAEIRVRPIRFPWRVDGQRIRGTAMWRTWP